MVSASPVRCSMKSCGRMATDSSQMEKAQRIWRRWGRVSGEIYSSVRKGWAGTWYVGVGGREGGDGLL